MREIKFRKFVEYYDGEKPWIPYDPCIGFQKDKNPCFVYYNTSTGHLIDKAYKQSKIKHILSDELQYLNCKDKHGKEVYEGDIVKYMELSGEWRAVIKYHEENCSFDPLVYNNDNPNDPYWRSWEDIYIDTLEVIGNIHEDPELINP